MTTSPEQTPCFAGRTRMVPRGEATQPSPLNLRASANHRHATVIPLPAGPPRRQEQNWRVEMSPSWLRILGLIVVSAWLAASCTGGKKIEVGGSCVLNSDCDRGLVCTWGKCHAACRTSVDCPAGQSCVTASDQSTVCQLPVETHCLYASDCQQPLSCAVDQRCHNQCQSNIDCPSRQTCTTTKTCAEPRQVDSNNNLIGTDGGVTGSGGDSGAGGTGTCTTGAELCPCLPDDTCNPGLICASRLCVRLGAGGSGGRGGTGGGGDAGVRDALGGQSVVTTGGTTGSGDAWMPDASGAPPDAPIGGTGGGVGAGGNPGTGVTTGTGGNPGVGGTTSSGGTGGATSVGGTAAGGTATGGSLATGGTTSTGGPSTSGGTPTTGGITASGGRGDAGLADAPSAQPDGTNRDTAGGAGGVGDGGAADAPSNCQAGPGGYCWMTWTDPGAAAQWVTPPSAGSAHLLAQGSADGQAGMEALLHAGDAVDLSAYDQLWFDATIPVGLQVAVTIGRGNRSEYCSWNLLGAGSTQYKVDLTAADYCLPTACGLDRSALEYVQFGTTFFGTTIDVNVTNLGFATVSRGFGALTSVASAGLGLNSWCCSTFAFGYGVTAAWASPPTSTQMHVQAVDTSVQGDAGMRIELPPSQQDLSQASHMDLDAVVTVTGGTQFWVNMRNPSGAECLFRVTTVSGIHTYTLPLASPDWCGTGQGRAFELGAVDALEIGSPWDQAASADIMITRIAFR